MKLFFIIDYFESIEWLNSKLNSSEFFVVADLLIITTEDCNFFIN